jgi:hypothetical protein
MQYCLKAIVVAVVGGYFLLASRLSIGGGDVSIVIIVSGVEIKSGLGHWSEID